MSGAGFGFETRSGPNTLEKNGANPVACKHFVVSESGLLLHTPSFAPDACKCLQRVEDARQHVRSCGDHAGMVSLEDRAVVVRHRRPGS